MVGSGRILVTGAAGQVGSVGRTVTRMLLDRGFRFAPWCGARTKGRRPSRWIAREFSDALNREVTYSYISPEGWEQELKGQGMPEHLTGLFGRWLHRAGRVQRVTGRRAMSVLEFVSLYAEEFGGRRSQTAYRARTQLQAFSVISSE